MALFFSLVLMLFLPTYSVSIAEEDEALAVRFNPKIQNQILGNLIKLTVTEPAGVERKSAPVSGGIPLMKNAFKKEQTFGIFANGKEIPSQVVPLVVDEKDMLRWVLVDFQADFKANEKKIFILKALKSEKSTKKKLKVIQNDGGITVDTGVMKFFIAKDQPFSLFSKVIVNGKTIVQGGEVSYTDCTKRDYKTNTAEFSKNDNHRVFQYFAGPPDEILVEHQGPMRATLKVSGRFKDHHYNKFRHISRITAWAGRSDVRVKYSLLNQNKDQYVYRLISDSRVSLRLTGNVTATRLGGDQPIDAGPSGWIKQSLLMATHPDTKDRRLIVKKDPAVSAGEGTKVLWSSKFPSDVPEGWLAVATDIGKIQVTDRFFHENPARYLSVTNGYLNLGGITERGTPSISTIYQGTNNERKVSLGQPYVTKARWSIDCSLLSSEYVIDFNAPDRIKAQSSFSKAARSALHAMAPPEWYFETESLEVGKFATQEEEVKCNDLWNLSRISLKNKEPFTGPKTPRSYIGSRRYTYGVNNHYDSEGDVLEMLALMYLRTGSRSFYDHAMAWANHGMDTRIQRTHGWRWKDGGIWWTKGGPSGGNRPDRTKDPVTQVRNYCPPAYLVHRNPVKGSLGVLADTRQCYCHNYGAGMASWFCITGEIDARDAVIDSIEVNNGLQRKYRKRYPGDKKSFSRDFCRAARVAMAARLISPTDPFVVENSDFYADVFLKRGRPELRGFVNSTEKVKRLKKKLTTAQIQNKIYDKRSGIVRHIGLKGVEEMKRLGITIDPETGALMDQEGHKWHPLYTPMSFLYPMLYRAMDSYYRITGNEDAHDWVIAIGKAFAQVAYQSYGNFAHYSVGAADLPIRGMYKDSVGYMIEGTDNKWAEGIGISGYTARHWVDAPARAYSLCGEPLLKQRAYDYWLAGSHRGYNAKKMRDMSKVGMWMNFNTTRENNVGMTGHTFYIWSHTRKDQNPPEPITDLKVIISGKKATVTFTSPHDDCGGTVDRYQVKCSRKPIVGYEKFLKYWKTFTENNVTNWFMGKNMDGEPSPKAPGLKERFVLTNFPDYIPIYFAVRSFDNSSNRSGMSNNAKAVVK